MKPAPEARFLVEAARPAADLEAAARALRESDPDRLLALAGRHRVQAAAADLAARLGFPAPGLEAERRRVAAAGLEGLARLIELTAALGAAGVRTVALKGPLQSLRYFGNPGQRDSDDLDLLVARDAVGPAVEVLRALGHQPDDPFTAAGERLRTAYTNSQVWMREGRAVDLHWEPAETHFGGVPAEVVLARSVPVEVGGATVLAPDAAVELVLTACHAAKHGFGRLDWLAVIGRIRAGADLDAAAELAGRHRARRRLARALELADELEGGRLDAGLLEREPIRGARAVAGHLGLSDGPQEAAGLLVRLSVTPNSADLRIARGGRARTYLSRPPRLVGRATRRLVFRSD